MRVKHAKQEADDPILALLKQEAETQQNQETAKSPAQIDSST
jgi:hypothetical protein